MTDLSQTMGAAGLNPPPRFRPWKPRRWNSRNTPSELRLVPDKSGAPVIPKEDLSFLLNARPNDIFAWRHKPGFPAERRAPLTLSAVGYRPEELMTFLKTLPREHQARVCPALPLGEINARKRGLDFRLVGIFLRPTVKEILVAAGVMIATAALGLWAIVAAAG
jgi:hypothetical protein